MLQLAAVAFAVAGLYIHDASLAPLPLSLAQARSYPNSVGASIAVGFRTKSVERAGYFILAWSEGWALCVAEADLGLTSSPLFRR